MPVRDAASAIAIIAARMILGAFLVTVLGAGLALLVAAPLVASESSRRLAAHRAHSYHTLFHRGHVRSVNAEYAGVRYASGHVRGRLTAARGAPHYAALVGNRASGYGFYPLPLGVRIAAWRYRQRRAMQAARDIGIAVASTAVYSNWGPFGYGDGFGHHHGVFNPIDGVGTPFFAGYYGGGGDDDDPGPFSGGYGD